jgi:hypothetical protein
MCVSATFCARFHAGSSLISKQNTVTTLFFDRWNTIDLVLPPTYIWTTIEHLTHLPSISTQQYSYGVV